MHLKSWKCSSTHSSLTGRGLSGLRINDVTSTGTPELFGFAYIQDLLAQIPCWEKAATLLPDWPGCFAEGASTRTSQALPSSRAPMTLQVASGEGSQQQLLTGLCHTAAAQKLRDMLPDGEALKPWVERDLQLCPRSHGRELPASEGAAAAEHWAAPEGTALQTDRHSAFLERLNQAR